MTSRYEEAYARLWHAQVKQEKKRSTKVSHHFVSRIKRRQREGATVKTRRAC